MKGTASAARTVLDRRRQRVLATSRAKGADDADVSSRIGETRSSRRKSPGEAANASASRPVGAAASAGESALRRARASSSARRRRRRPRCGARMRDGNGTPSGGTSQSVGGTARQRRYVARGARRAPQEAEESVSVFIASPRRTHRDVAGVRASGANRRARCANRHSATRDDSEVTSWVGGEDRHGRKRAISSAQIS